MAENDTSTTTSLVDLEPGKSEPARDAGDSTSSDVGGSQTQAPAPSATPAQQVVSGPWINEDGSFVSDWTSRLPEDVREEATQMKLGDRVRSVSDLARVTVNAQRLAGKKGVIPPSEKSTPEEISEYRKVMGVPETIDGYKVKPEKVPEGMEWKDEDAKPFLEIAHKYHAPPALMKELVAAHVARQAQLAEQMTYTQTQLLQKKYDEGIADLNHAWGKKFSDNRDRVVQACLAKGCPPNTSGLLDPNVVKLVLNLRDDISDEKFVSASGGGGTAYGTIDPGQLALSIVNDKSNPDYEKYHNLDPQTTTRVEALFREASRLKERRG